MKWPRLIEESEENGSTTDEIQELEEIEEEENEYDPDDTAEKLMLLVGGKPWLKDVRPDGEKVVMVVGRGAPESEQLPYELDGVPIEVIFKDED